MSMPRWLEEVLGAACEACVDDVEGRMSGFSCRWARPEENPWGTWLLVIAPSMIEIAGGKDDGTTGFDFVDVDLLALPNCLDEVESLNYDPDYGGEPHLTLVGEKGKRELVVEIYFEPFEDAERLAQERPVGQGWVLIGDERTSELRPFASPEAGKRRRPPRKKIAPTRILYPTRSGVTVLPEALLDRRRIPL